MLAYPTDLREHRAGTQLDLVAEVREGSELVWRGVSTYLARGVWTGPKPAGEHAPRDPFVPPTRTGSWVLPADTGRAYAAVMGDYNPIHLWAPTAKALGMKRAIAHGMYLAGRALAGAAPHGAGYSWNIEFSTPVFLPSTVDVAFSDEERTTDVQRMGCAQRQAALLPGRSSAPSTADPHRPGCPVSSGDRTPGARAGGAHWPCCMWSRTRCPHGNVSTKWMRRSRVPLGTTKCYLASASCRMKRGCGSVSWGTTQRLLAKTNTMAWAVAQQCQANAVAPLIRKS